MRHKPRLIEPSPVIIEQKSTGTTDYDELLREPIKQVARVAAVTLSAQVSWGHSFAAGYHEGGQGGTVDDATGYLVFLREDLSDSAVTLAIGDRVTTIGGIAHNLYLSRVTYAGHHLGQPWLEVWDFQDYAPQKVA